VTEFVLVRDSGASRPDRLVFSRSEWSRIAGLYAVVLLLHVSGWGLYLYYAARHVQLVGLGLVAYMFGLRHAFDADHIAAVDDTVRYLLQKGKRPLAIGFFFSLGHSTVVLALAVAIAFAATAVKIHLPALQSIGGLIGVGQIVSSRVIGHMSSLAKGAPSLAAFDLSHWHGHLSAGFTPVTSGLLWLGLAAIAIALALALSRLVEDI